MPSTLPAAFCRSHSSREMPLVSCEVKSNQSSPCGVTNRLGFCSDRVGSLVSQVGSVHRLSWAGNLDIAMLMSLAPSAEPANQTHSRSPLGKLAKLGAWFSFPIGGM